MTFTREQVDALLRPIKAHRVSNDGKGHSHVEAYEIAAHLTRIFGFGNWRKEILSLECVHERSEEKGNRTGWWVVYRCQMRLHVGEWWTDDVATGDASNQVSPGDAHDMASKTAVSQALKRCAKDLGDQFGLSLYNGGSLHPVVGKTLVLPRPLTPAQQHEEEASRVWREGPDLEDAAPRPEPATGEVLLPDAWPDAPGPGEEIIFIPLPLERAVEDVQTDLGGIVPPASTKDHLAAAHEKLDAVVPMMTSSVRRSIHTAAKLLGHEGQAGHEWARAEGNRALGQAEDISMETWTREQGADVLKHVNALVKEAR